MKMLGRGFPMIYKVCCVTICQLITGKFRSELPTVSKKNNVKNWQNCTHKPDTDMTEFQLLRIFISMEIRVKIKLKYKI